VGCSTLIGELTKEALREGKWLVKSEVLRGGAMSIISGLRRGESIVNCDNCDGDMGVSSKQRTKQNNSEHSTQSNHTVARDARTWSKNVRASLHALDPALDPPDVDESEYDGQSDDPADGAAGNRQDGHGGRRTHNGDRRS
jgi:hypothetical protein